eukprot:scaffold1130_cov195-Pinguiococcus_pyrenoidosus.AAC.32
MASLVSTPGTGRPASLVMDVRTSSRSPSSWSISERNDPAAALASSSGRDRPSWVLASALRASSNAARSRSLGAPASIGVAQA